MDDMYRGENLSDNVSDVDDSSDKLHAAVHFYHDSKKNIVIVKTNKIKNFVQDQDVLRKPHFILRPNILTGDEEYAPAQVHQIASRYSAILKATIIL